MSRRSPATPFLPVVPSKLLEQADVLLGHEAWAGVNVVRRNDPIAGILSQEHHRQVPLEIGLLINRRLHRAVLDRLRDIAVEIEADEALELPGGPHVMQELDRRVGGVPPERPDAVRLAM